MQPMHRRSFLKAVGGATAGASLFLSGCAPAILTGAKKTLNFWAFSSTRTQWQQKAWELYKQEKKPDFEINWMIFPFQQMHDKILITALAGSGGPDIADIEIGQFARFIKGDVIFTDMTSKLQQMGIADQFYRPSATDPWSWQGKIYGIGNELNACLLSYRWDLFEKAGIKAPITTWDEFAEAGRNYHKATGKYFIDFPFNDSGYWWIQTLQGKGGFFDASGKPIFNSPEGLKTLSYQKQALAEGWASIRPVGQAYWAKVSDGTFASLIGPSWNFSGFVQQNSPDTAGKWLLQPLPLWEAGGSNTATQGGTGVAVLKTSSSVEEALDFVLYEHSSVEALLGDYSIRQTWPTFKPALEQAKLSEPLKFFNNQSAGGVIKEVAPQINKWYNSPYWPETTDAFTRLALTPCLQQAGVSPASALKAADGEATRIINFETA
ncbi:ABC transporter substrate-binding protein [Ktedonospora formicarum]|uniref:Putative arabinose-binding protein n=1 Tax=Ktedonospora formicarum TaxID=2778364 RepID=A0A8J3MP29_9CHLR|nr:substrate-binding domain-containing protein [Ktedonospora formicarum]GHO42505.1 putative arabinose-binding protein [Ktedonospora formicarum]